MPRKISIKPSADIAKKWAEVTPGRESYYAAETPAAASVWEANTKAASGNYKSSISAAGIEQRFSGGVAKAGAAKFARKVTAVGVSRFGPGVSAAKDDMAAGFDPHQAVLAALTIPDRAPRGSTSNYRVVDVVGDALHKKRLALLGATGAS
jgi:hypothetical protein